MSLFDHIGFESGNIPASYKFYSACMSGLGLRVLRTAEDMFFVSGSRSDPLPFLRVTAQKDIRSGVSVVDFQPGKHLHLRFKAETHAQVEMFYKAALAAGGRNSDAPSYHGPKEAGYYAALVFDPDGNTVEVGIRQQLSQAG